MYDYLIAVILGIVEGATEFLPVSSTGHMILVGYLMGYDGQQAGVFEVFIQLGAIMAVAVIYKEKILTMLHFNGWRLLLRRENWRRSDTGLTLVHIAAGAVPVLPVGYLLHHFIKTYLFSVETVLVGLVAGGDEAHDDGADGPGGVVPAGSQADGRGAFGYADCRCGADGHAGDADGDEACREAPSGKQVFRRVFAGPPFDVK